MEKYLNIDGLCFKEDGWSEKDKDLFIDKLIEIAESFGNQVQLTASVRTVTEAELEEELKDTES